jgi:hypothetical protein
MIEGEPLLFILWTPSVIDLIAEFCHHHYGSCEFEESIGLECANDFLFFSVGVQ